jgi:transcriptional regulator GlxA family with amidase domain
MKVGILLYKHCSLWSAVGPMELFNRANKAQEYYYGTSKKSKFSVDFIAGDTTEVETSFPYPVNVKYSIANHNKLDLILIPGFEAEPHEVVSNSKEIADWLKDQYLQGTMLASICTGSVLLALTGLIDHKTATTHWLLKDFFESCFPQIRLDLSKVVIDYKDILMSGSATSFQNLIVYIIEKHMGRNVATGVSKVYLIDINKDRPDSYMNLIPQKRHNDTQIKKAQRYIEENCCAKMSIDELCKQVSLSKRTFLRRFRNATNDTPLNYIHKVKIEKAKELLENERITFEEIAYSLGYEDVNAFRKIFVRQTGISPKKYKARFYVEV